jgi:hypothetical protein
MPSKEQSGSELINKVIEALPGSPEEKEQRPKAFTPLLSNLQRVSKSDSLMALVLVSLVISSRIF